MKFYPIKILVIVAITTSLTLTGCASILNPGHQKVNFVTSSSDSKLFIDNIDQGTGKNVTVKLKRDATVKQIRVEREGYKPTYSVFYQTKKSPWYIMSVVPFTLLLYPPFSDNARNAYNYEKTFNTASNMSEIQKRTDTEKYVYLKNTAFDIKKEDLKYTKIKQRDLKKNKNNYKSNGESEEDIKFDNSIFTDAVNEVLKKYNYIDTTNTIFKSKTNTVYISSKISKVEFANVYSNTGRFYMNYLKTKLSIEWEIFDLYDQSKYKQTYKAESGDFSFDFEKENAVKKSIEDAITESFFKFMDTKEVKKLIKKEASQELKMEKLLITRPAIVNNLEEAMNATVTIKTKNGHGSGCFISNDGYIVTNFHVVSNNDKLTVITKEGKEYSAKLVRKNEFSDLALIKVDGTFPKAFRLPDTKNYKVGENIFAIGTPKSIELGQSLSKGIISGFRTYENNDLIQTDASVNGGNSGGALVNKNGEFIGVVNAKVFGVGVEGLGFSIPAEIILSNLSIAY